MNGLIIIDEIQRVPELFALLRVLVDDEDANKQFLILGSASRGLIQQTSESLVGRIAHIELTPFTYNETHELDKLWLRVGFPRSYLANTRAINKSILFATINVFCCIPILCLMIIGL